MLLQLDSEFVFDPAKWPREQMDEDFLKLSTMFNAMKSVVRAPDIDPKYKIAVLASKQQIAYEYAKRKANIVLVARREYKLRGISENAMLLGANHVLIMAADVVKEDDCKRFINETMNLYGRGLDKQISDLLRTPALLQLTSQHLQQQP
ncbi:hypothetical protein F0562_027960 [Nyssa sinensis]|uniref:Uncharacterized protein n=1 Tax=Nyssa sinensis TaxID=561372 RepID=A0A5J5B8Z2_9ASTE|nr:hypothetical protein F0562_027960 [Nyssa sinensis]